jgi:nicotinic acid phosphoribosyltransferase
MTDDEKIMILKETFKGRNDAYGEGAGLCTKKPITDAISDILPD